MTADEALARELAERCWYKPDNFCMNDVQAAILEAITRAREECAAACEKIRPPNPRSDWTEFAEHGDRVVTLCIERIRALNEREAQG